MLCAAPSPFQVSHVMRTPDLLRGLEQLDWIAIRIFDVDLPAAGTDFHVIAKMNPGRFQRAGERREICHAEDDAVPPAGRLPEHPYVADHVALHAIRHNRAYLWRKTVENGTRHVLLIHGIVSDA
jgi:hypothetical protein